MLLAPWRSLLARALHHNRRLPNARYMQLATVRQDGKPANRTVVFRGFLDNSNHIKIVTDSRSEKLKEIEVNPWGELCWYFPETREQFRLAGPLILVGANHADTQLLKARQTAWQELSAAARLQFAWPHPGEERAEPASFEPAPPDQEKPLANFCLLLLEPARVDHLELRGEPENRWLYLLQDSGLWSSTEINP